MKLNISKKIVINKSIIQVYQVIADIKQWNLWSPWMHSEPTAVTKASGVSGEIGQTQSWIGEVIGSGQMTITNLKANQLVEMKIEFLSPWKSVAQALFQIKELDAEQTEVTWIMNSQLPLFMIFFKNMMMAYMGHDFERGLKMLKEYVETGAVISTSIYQGEKLFSEFYVLGYKTSCRISEISTRIRADFESLQQLLQTQDISQPEMMVTLSHVHNIPKGLCEFTAGYCYLKPPQFKIPPGYFVTHISNHKGLLVDHYGPYRHIANPWSMAVSYQRGQKKKILKKVPMYELYKTVPDGRPEKDIHTQIVMPIR